MFARQKILLISLGVVLVGVVIYHWCSGNGLVTLDFDNVPAGKVIKALESRGGIRVVTNGDLTAPISIHLKNAPVYEAADTVATRMGGDLRVAYVGAPQTSQIESAFKAFQTNENPGGWTVFAFGGWGGGGPGGNGGGNNNQPNRNADGGNQPTANPPAAGTPDGGNRTVGGGNNRRGGPGGGGGWGGGFGGGMDFGGGSDPRFVEWKISDMTDRNLQAYYNQGFQKTGALFAVPTDWNPVLVGLPKSGKTQDMAKKIASAGKGKVQEVFLITVNQRQEGEPDQPRFTPTVFSASRGQGRQMNPEWIAERTQAQIAVLPPEERVQAQKDVDAFRAFRDSLKNLTEEERRAKWEEFMKNPEVQERMEERQATRDSRNSPDQRDSRARNYLERKQSMKGSL